MRILDDTDDMSGYLRRTESESSFGRLIMTDKSDRTLKLRDVANKIIHASEIGWDFTNEERPLLICTSREPERWERAEIDVVSVAAFCGGLMH